MKKGIGMSSNLTVVVPVYNVEKYLSKCVDSILNQTLSVDEIILVDDGSTDKSGLIADDYAKKYDIIKVVHQKNGGLSAARNTGINLATMEYIAFVDSDDYIAPTMYEVLIERLKKNDADISIGGVWYEQEDGEKYTPYPDGITRNWNKTESLIQLNSYQYFNMSFCDAIFKRSLFEMTAYGEGSLSFPVGKLCEDFYLMHRIVARTEKITYTSTPFYHYVQRENSISRNAKVNLAPMDASLAQLEFYAKWFPQLVYVAETACFFAYASVYTTYCRYGQTCPDSMVTQINSICYKFFLSVLRNKYIPKAKKAQAVVFCCSKRLYKIVIKKKKHR